MREQVKAQVGFRQKEQVQRVRNLDLEYQFHSSNIDLKRVKYERTMVNKARLFSALKIILKSNLYYTRVITAKRVTNDGPISAA